jgi:hypothetical protein
MTDPTLYGFEPPEPEPFRPGDSLSVFPVRTDAGMAGYIAVRQDADRVPTAEENEPVRPVWVLDDGTETPFGPVERALRADVGALNTTSRLARTLIASATALAQAMDRAAPDKVASIGKELREHIKRIEEEAGDTDDSSNHRSSLSTPV